MFFVAAEPPASLPPGRERNAHAEAAGAGGGGARASRAVVRREADVAAAHGQPVRLADQRGADQADRDVQVPHLPSAHVGSRGRCASARSGGFRCGGWERRGRGDRRGRHASRHAREELELLIVLPPEHLRAAGGTPRPAEGKGRFVRPLRGRAGRRGRGGKLRRRKARRGSQGEGMSGGRRAARSGWTMLKSFATTVETPRKCVGRLLPQRGSWSLSTVTKVSCGGSAGPGVT